MTLNCVQPCPCGFYGDTQKLCTHAVVPKYQERISDPLLDCIDIHIEVPRVDYEKLSADRFGESSESISTRVQVVRDVQLERFAKIESRNIICNTDMHIDEIRKFCKLQEEGQSLMRAAVSQSPIINAEIKSLDKDARTMKWSRDNSAPLCYFINIYSG